MTRSRSTIPTQVGGEVELVLAVDARQLGRLAADQRDTRRAADLGGALDEVGDLLQVDVVRGDVVEQDQRVGAARDHVVDAVRGHVGAAGAQRAALGGRRSASSRSSRSRPRAAAARRAGAGRRRRRNRGRPSTRRLCGAARRFPLPSQARPRRRRTSGRRSRVHSTRWVGRQVSSSPCSCGRPCGPPGMKLTTESPTITLVPSSSVSSSSARTPRLRLGVVGEQLQLRQLEHVPRLEQLVEPLARRMHLEPVAGVRGDERPAAAVRLDAQLLLDCAVDDARRTRPRRAPARGGRRAADPTARAGRRR